MNEINFLPATYVQKRARHFRVYREVIWLAAMAVVIGAWQVATRGSLNDLETMATTLESQVAATQGQKSETLKMQTRKQELLESVRVERELALPVNISCVMGKIGELMPPSMALTSLDIVDPRPEPVPKAQPGADGSPAPRAKSGASGLLRIELVGLAAADVDVADFVGRLSTCRLFNNVKMPFSRATQAGNLQAREFRIEMEVSLERDYLTSAAKNEGKAAEKPSLLNSSKGVADAN